MLTLLEPGGMWCFTATFSWKVLATAEQVEWARQSRLWDQLAPPTEDGPLQSLLADGIRQHPDWPTLEA